MKTERLVIVLILCGFFLQPVFAQEVSEGMGAGGSETVVTPEAPGEEIESEPVVGEDVAVDETDNPSADEVDVAPMENENEEPTQSDVGGIDVENNGDGIPVPGPETNEDDNPTVSTDPTDAGDKENGFSVTPGDEGDNDETPPVAENPTVNESGSTSVEGDKDCVIKDQPVDSMVVIGCEDDGLDNPPVSTETTGEKNTPEENCDAKAIMVNGSPSGCDDGNGGGETTPPVDNGGGSSSPNGNNSNENETQATGTILFSFNPLWNPPATKSLSPAPAPAAVTTAPTSEGTSSPSSGLTGGNASPPSDSVAPAALADTPATDTNPLTGLLSGITAPIVGLLALLIIGGVLYARSRNN